IYGMVIMLPPTLVTLMIFWKILNFRFPMNSLEATDLTEFITEERRKQGSISNNEVKLLTLYFILIILWVTQSWHGMSIPMSAVMVSLFLFFPFINLLNWGKTVTKVDWGVPLLFAAGF